MNDKDSSSYLSYDRNQIQACPISQKETNTTFPVNTQMMIPQVTPIILTIILENPKKKKRMNSKYIGIQKPKS